MSKSGTIGYMFYCTFHIHIYQVYLIVYFTKISCNENTLSGLQKKQIILNTTVFNKEETGAMVCSLTTLLHSYVALMI